MSDCGGGGSTRWFYTGNQVGYLNFCGDLNFLGGGPAGSGLSAGTLVPVFFPPPTSREPWKNQLANLSQELLNAAYPFMELNWIADLHLRNGVTIRVSDKNLYVQDEDGSPRYYEARVSKAPQINVTLGEWLNPQFQVGDMSLTLNNRDGFFNKYLPHGKQYQQWISAKVEIKVGFGIKFENYFTLFNGYITQKQGVTTTENDVTIKCYDQFDQDNRQIPSQVFSTISNPEVQEEAEGKAIPIVYGDWTEDVPKYGAIPAYCTNANQEDPTSFTFKVSDNGLQSIDEIYLHRGNRGEDKPEGPIRIDVDLITVDLDKGEFYIPVFTPVLFEASTILEKGKAGIGSGQSFITAEANVNYIEKHVSVGDNVIKLSTSESSTINNVANAQLGVIEGTIFNEGDEYAVTTLNYRFIQGDKITIKCKGKNTRRMSKNRIPDYGITDNEPYGLTLDFDNNFWYADDSARKIFCLDFKRNVIKEISYDDVDSNITKITGITWQQDESIWIYDHPTSTVYRYMLEQEALGLKFSTLNVIGLSSTLVDGRGLTIDEGNVLYIVDNSTGTFYKINPFNAINPLLVTSWNRSAFEASAVEITDLSADVNQQNLLVADRYTGKFYRINRTTGALIADSAILFSEVGEDINYPVGISSAQDGTVFVLNRNTVTLYNFNEIENAYTNPGFIARDLLQSYAGKTSGDFDLVWNQTSREQLSQYRARIYIGEFAELTSTVSKLLQQYNTAYYLRFGKYAAYQITFEKFRNDGGLIREGDLKDATFNPAKEWNQYFNSASCDYKQFPASGKQKTSDTYLSPSGITLSGRQIDKKLLMPSVYRRQDVDKLMPLFVRLAAAEPEFVNMTVTWRMLFTQPMDFFRIAFDTPISPIDGTKLGGRRFNNVPCFVRQIRYDLDTMTLGLKVWSLGTTAFGNYIPEGLVAGGQNDLIVLTTLGTIGYIAPVGAITSATADTATIEDVNGETAEVREAPICGKAWQVGFKIAIVDATTHEVLEEATIESVSGQVIQFEDALTTVLSPTVRNISGVIESGHYLRYADYDSTSVAQRKYFASYGPPVVGYPSTTSNEIEEQRSGTHHFSDNRPPYILHPKDFVPSV